MRPAKALESEEQRDIIKATRRLGGKAVIFSQPRASMQTKGIADLKIYFLSKGLTFWWETKRRENGRLTKQREGQKEFQAMEEKCGGVYKSGDFDDYRTYLRAIGILEAT